jgi:hypothetical protein
MEGCRFSIGLRNSHDQSMRHWTLSHNSGLRRTWVNFWKPGSHNRSSRGALPADHPSHTDNSTLLRLKRAVAVMFALLPIWASCGHAPGALATLGRGKQPACCFLMRHATGGWGTLDPVDSPRTSTACSRISVAEQRNPRGRGILRSETRTRMPDTSAFAEMRKLLNRKVHRAASRGRDLPRRVHGLQRRCSGPPRSPLCMLLWKTGNTSATHSLTVNNPTACIRSPRAFAAETLH